MPDLRHPTFSLWRSRGPTASLCAFIQQAWALGGSFPKPKEKGPLSTSHTLCLRAHSTRDLVFLCSDKWCVPVLWAAQDAPGGMLKASEGSQGKALGGSEGLGCHPLPQPHPPLPFGWVPHGTFLSHTSAEDPLPASPPQLTHPRFPPYPGQTPRNASCPSFSSAPLVSWLSQPSLQEAALQKPMAGSCNLLTPCQLSLQEERCFPCS